jgi:SAM-dependent methyltransferase
MSIKKYISSFFRRLNLGRLADGCRYAFVYGKKYMANRAYARLHSNFAFPPPYFMYETYTLDFKAYLEDGRQTAAEIMALFTPYINFKEGRRALLDWGCGPGRVVRHLPQLAGAGNSIAGCDYNEVYINWCTKNIEGVQFLKNELQPPLPLAADSIDGVYGLSIFAHLAAESHTTWAAELLRILKPGGVLVITVQGDRSKVKLMPSELEQYNKGLLVVRGFEKEGHRLYSAFQPPVFMRSLFSNYLVLQHIPGGERGGLDNMQDTWVLQKPTG